MNAATLQQIIEQFEAGIYPKEQWTHRAHFEMALWYCYHQPLSQAILSIKEGIKNYNIKTGGQNTEDSGYHETITVFYTREIIHFLVRTEERLTLDELLAQLDQQPFIAKDYPFNFYSKDVLMSKEARKRWVAPDKMMTELLKAASY